MSLINNQTNALNANTLNANALYENFKNVFLSSNNTNYIYNFVITKISRAYDISLIQSNLETYKITLIELQKIIFDKYFFKIYKDHDSQDNKDDNNLFEDVLIAINKMTMSQLEYVILQNMQEYKVSQDKIPENESSRPEKDKMEMELYEREKSYNPNTNTDITANPTTNVTTTIVSDNKNKKDVSTQQIPVSCHDKFTQYEGVGVSNIDVGVSNINVGGSNINLCKNCIVFSSENCDFENGTYKFDIHMENVKCITLSSLSIDCNLYNIDEYNNKFILIENDIKINIIIPIGFYRFAELLSSIKEEMINASINKNIYNIYLHNNKNKVYIKCENQNNRFNNFSIIFNRSQGALYDLPDILGFENEEYKCSNIYVSEFYPITLFFDELFLKIYLNNKNIPKIKNNDNTFSYYDKYDLDYDTNFSKKYNYKQASEIFELKYIENITSISFDFLINTTKQIKSFMNFSILLDIECNECNKVK